jgi:hypothetical protein
VLSATAAEAVCGAGVTSYNQDKDGWHYGNYQSGLRAQYDKKVEGAEPDSFHVLPGSDDIVYNPCARDSGYAADKSHVYKGADIMPGADPRTFTFLPHGYARDAAHVYLAGAQIKDADSATFRVAGNDESAFSAEDVKHYFQGITFLFPARHIHGLIRRHWRMWDGLTINVSRVKIVFIRTATASMSFMATARLWKLPVCSRMERYI